MVTTTTVVVAAAAAAAAIDGAERRRRKRVIGDTREKDPRFTKTTTTTTRSEDDIVYTGSSRGWGLASVAAVATKRERERDYTAYTVFESNRQFTTIILLRLYRYTHTSLVVSFHFMAVK